MIIFQKLEKIYNFCPVQLNSDLASSYSEQFVVSELSWLASEIAVP